MFRCIDCLFICVVLPCSIISLFCAAFVLGCDYSEWKNARSGAVAEVIVKPS